MEGSDTPEDEASLEGCTNKDNSTSESATAQDTEELAKFRLQWREELGLKGVADNGLEGVTDRDQEDRRQGPVEDMALADGEAEVEQKSPQEKKEDEAAGLYWMGVAAEQSGDMDSALMYYRRAVQLVPDIEFKVSKNGPPLDDDDEAELEDDRQESGDTVLLDEFQSLSLDKCCEPNRQTKDLHISNLPVEVLRYIFKWVVSEQLDMRSLEQLSMVCKGFYMLAREQEIWRKACKKLWKDCLPSPQEGGWRKMYILNPHLNFNGVYISKTSYIRQGEHSVDGFYKPYHTVTYYRYLRLFSDGSVMYQTSPEEPALVVNKLCKKHSSESVLIGKYQLQGKKILIDLAFYRYNQQQSNRHHRSRGRGRAKQPEVGVEQKFHMELLLHKRKSKQLTWVEHSLHRLTDPVQVSHFTIDYKYTPFSFSRVKSFTFHSYGMLT